MQAVRRLGTRPSGATPASAATSSAQAPAALTSTGAANVARAGADLPEPVPPRDGPYRRAGQDRAALGPDPAHEALVQGVDVDVHRAGFVHGAAVPAGPHDRAELLHFVQPQLAHARDALPAVGEGGRSKRSSAPHGASATTPRGVSSGCSANAAGGASKKGRAAAVSARTQRLP